MVATPLVLSQVSVWHDDATILADVSWTVAQGQRWVVLGPNGSGKTTLLRIASLYLHPSSGTVAVDGEVLGRTDVRRLRTRIGLASPAFGDLLRPQLTAREVVMTARHAALEPWWHTYEDIDRTAAADLLDRFGVGHLADRAVGTLSSGERQRVLLARAFSGDPAIVLLDDPPPGSTSGAGRTSSAGSKPSAPSRTARRRCSSPTTSRRSRRRPPTCSSCGRAGSSDRARSRRCSPRRRCRRCSASRSSWPAGGAAGARPPAG